VPLEVEGDFGDGRGIEIPIISSYLRIIDLPVTPVINNLIGKTAFSLHIETSTENVDAVPAARLDDAGAPMMITHVNDISELDLSPLTVDTVKVGNLVLKANQSIILESATDETKQLICVTNAELGIDAFARTRDALVSELNEQIGMLWGEYALAADDDLDGVAIKMKQALLTTFSEVGRGA